MPKVIHSGTSSVASVAFTTDGKTNRLWFEVEGKNRDYLVGERVDAFLVGLLYLAMKRAGDIHIHAPISERLFYNLSTFLIPAISIANISD